MCESNPWWPKLCLPLLHGPKPGLDLALPDPAHSLTNGSYPWVLRTVNGHGGRPVPGPPVSGPPHRRAPTRPPLWPYYEHAYYEHEMESIAPREEES
jgi:hypothetical protein